MEQNESKRLIAENIEQKKNLRVVTMRELDNVHNFSQR